MISKQQWGMDTSSLIHLSNSLIRSRLTYGQEVFFSAPKQLLKKIQSIDCKGLKIALGVPSHTSCTKTYLETEVIPLEDQRKLACAKYIVRCSALESYNETEISLRSDLHFAKRAKSISSQVTLATYSANILKDSGVIPSKTSKKPAASSIPKWELIPPIVDFNHSYIKKKQVLMYWQ